MSANKNVVEKDIIEDEEVYINADDGLPNSHPNIEDIEVENPSEDEETIFNDLPKSLIVTNIRREVFNDEKQKEEMENLFRCFSENVTFQWLRSFNRLRVNFDTPVAAANARIKLHQFPVCESNINCYFAQPVTPVTMKNLQPPKPHKQFLISPPSSPPIGWEPREENEPLVNHDLLAALANLTPGESHEIHPPDGDHPAIIIHTASLSAHQPKEKLILPHTRCPDH